MDSVLLGVHLFYSNICAHIEDYALLKRYLISILSLCFVCFSSISSKEQISTLYSLTNDLQSPAQSREVREEVVDFYVTIVKTQFEQLGLARVHLFGVVEWKARDKDKVSL